MSICLRFLRVEFTFKKALELKINLILELEISSIKNLSPTYVSFHNGIIVEFYGEEELEVLIAVEEFVVLVEVVFVFVVLVVVLVFVALVVVFEETGIGGT